jgi:molybdopterin-containing oxidoreductase family iron-sulfur binding subunit
MSEPEFSRRQFLGLIGASAALASGCSNPDRGEIVPFTKRPAGVRPGVADLYASTFQEGLSAYGVLVKTREGRPIHVEGNERHPAFNAKTSLRAIADLMGLYDPDRLKRPLAGGKPSDWASAEGKLLAVLKDARSSGKPVLLMTGALLSPSRKALIKDLANALPGLRHVAWEPALGAGSESAALAECYGDARPPRLRLERAKLIVALEADLLSADRTEQIAGFAANRTERAMNRLYAFEGAMSLTGANADARIPWRPSRAAALGFALARALQQKGRPLPAGVEASALSGFELEALAREHNADPAVLRALVEDLKGAGSSALVVAGPALPPQAHAAAFLLNTMLGAEGQTVDASLAPPAESLARPEEIGAVLREAGQDRFSAAIFWDVNPAYAFPDAALWKAAAAAIPFKARIGLYEDETAKDCDLVFPANHWLESWNDFETSAELLSLQQPAVGPLYETKQAEDILLDLLRGLGGSPAADYHQYLMARWSKDVQPAGSPVAFERFWSAALHDGVLRREAKVRPPRRLDGGVVTRLARMATPSGKSDFELILAPSAGVYDGRYANNAWLQELPDPMTKLSWSNSVSVSPADAARFSLKDGDLVSVAAAGGAIELPVVVQPGQATGVLSAALGYGRRTGSVAKGVGVDLYPLLDAKTGLPRSDVKIKKTGRHETLAFIQRHHSMEGRDIVRSMSLAEARKGRLTHRKELVTLYPPLKFPKHKWAMAVDLSLCVGCQSCVIACQSENNIPTVGRERVLRGREMHWMRIDRYYEGPAENPQVLLQPMLCQQCDDAPCENVCPVAATNHSDEGINQMAYNRCVGTRYCQNNCPYKVRRFNFFEYTATTPESQRLAFNPEVTVRPRGVMEKCTFCIQRIQEAKSAAKVAGRPLRDGDIVPACAAACPARAIVFGDLKDPDSRVAKLAVSDRGYRVLEEIGVRPAVTYLADLTNPAGGSIGS